MRATILGSTLLLGASFAAGSLLYAVAHRYAVVGTSNGAFEVDAWTGRVWNIYDGKVLMQERVAQAEPSDFGIVLPPQELAKIAPGKIHGANGTLEGDFYNGSAWTLKRTVFSVTAQDRDGNPLWTRDYSYWQNVQAWTSDAARIGSVWLPEGVTVSWTMKQASGTPPPKE